MSLSSVLPSNGDDYIVRSLGTKLCLPCVLHFLSACSCCAYRDSDLMYLLAGIGAPAHLRYVVIVVLAER